MGPRAPLPGRPGGRVALESPAGEAGPSMPSESSRLQSIREKVEVGERLSFEDGLALEGSNDLFALGSMANLVRERINGNYAYYNVNMHLNPTNVCVFT